MDSSDVRKRSKPAGPRRAPSFNLRGSVHESASRASAGSPETHEICFFGLNLSKL